MFVDYLILKVTIKVKVNFQCLKIWSKSHIDFVCKNWVFVCNYPLNISSHKKVCIPLWHHYDSGADAKISQYLDLSEKTLWSTDKKVYISKIVVYNSCPRIWPISQPTYLTNCSFIQSKLSEWQPPLSCSCIPNVLFTIKLTCLGRSPLLCILHCPVKAGLTIYSRKPTMDSSMTLQPKQIKFWSKLKSAGNPS